jgi:hypothetical protein
MDEKTLAILQGLRNRMRDRIVMVPGPLLPASLMASNDLPRAIVKMLRERLKRPETPEEMRARQIAEVERMEVNDPSTWPKEIK